MSHSTSQGGRADKITDLEIKGETFKSEAETTDFQGDHEACDSLSSEKAESRLVRKLDMFIAPVMMLLMLISYLDRGNIGYAATQGMVEDINLEGSELNVSFQGLANIHSKFTLYY